jgi:hypothetical protein
VLRGQRNGSPRPYSRLEVVNVKIPSASLVYGHYLFRLTLVVLISRDSAVGIATVDGMDDQEVDIRVPVGSKIFPFRLPDRLWSLLNLLSNEYGRPFLRDKAVGA